MLSQLIESLVLDIDRIGEKHPDFFYSYVTIKCDTHGRPQYYAEVHFFRGITTNRIDAHGTTPEKLKANMQEEVEKSINELQLIAA